MPERLARTPNPTREALERRAFSVLLRKPKCAAMIIPREFESVFLFGKLPKNL